MDTITIIDSGPQMRDMYGRPVYIVTYSDGRTQFVGGPKPENRRTIW